MKFLPTPLLGAYVIELDLKSDARGHFARAFCAREMAEQGLKTDLVQVNMTYSRHKGTLRGLHYQSEPACDGRIVRCLHGRIWDVIIDMRPQSETYLQYFSIELSAENRRSVYIPDMFAHGHISLTDDVELIYLSSEYYAPYCERGVRYDDPAVGIKWPIPHTVISEKDLAWPLLCDCDEDGLSCSESKHL